MFAKEVLITAKAHLHRAIQQREAIYQGQREAKEHGRKKAGTTPLIEQQKFMSSALAAEMVADQNWQMRQADAHSGIAIAEFLSVLVEEQKLTNSLLARIATHTTGINGKMEDK